MVAVTLGLIVIVGTGIIGLKLPTALELESYNVLHNPAFQGCMANPFGYGG